MPAKDKNNSCIVWGSYGWIIKNMNEFFLWVFTYAEEINYSEFIKKKKKVNL